MILDSIDNRNSPFHPQARTRFRHTCEGNEKKIDDSSNQRCVRTHKFFSTEISIERCSRDEIKSSACMSGWRLFGSLDIEQYGQGIGRRGMSEQFGDISCVFWKS